MDLSEMSVDDFMKMDWGSEDSDGDKSTEKKSQDHKSNSVETSAKSTKKKKRRKKKVVDKQIEESAVQVEPTLPPPVPKGEKGSSSHQKVLDGLKDKDPEFYEFLQKEDSSLLKFDENDFDMDASSSDDEEDTGVHKLPEKLEEASDSDLDLEEDVLSASDDEEEQMSAKKAKDLIHVTEKMVEEWKTKLRGTKSSLPALRDLMKAFHCAIARFSQDDTDKKKKKIHLKFKVETSGIFNEVIGLCIRQVVPSLAKILNYFPDKSNKKSALPSQGKAWVKVRELMRTYLADVIALNQLLLEPSVICTTLRHTILLMPYFISYPKIAKLLLKFLIKSWSSADDESVRVLAFLCINRFIKLEKKRYLEWILKQTYLAYVANCKFTSPVLLPMINFMQQTLCELFAINTAITYQLAFLYIRQLAIHLRKAMTIHKKETCQAVYNWQYVHCLGLWSRMVGSLYSHDTIKPLLYPLVQVSLGAIDLVPTARYFPLRFNVIRYLTTLGDVTNTYIPLLPFITKPLRLAEFGKKKGENAEKPITFSTILKLSNSQLKEGAYRSITMDEVYFALMEFINSQAHTISFPEMMVPTVISLKKYMKGCKVPAYSKLIRQIVDRVQENSKFILERRSNVAFAVTDSEAVASWEHTLKVEGVPFNKHHAHYRKLHQRENQQAAADKNRIVEERLPVIDRQKFLEMSKSRDKVEFGDLFADDNETLEDLKFDVEKIVQEGRKKASSNRTETREVSDSDADSNCELEDEDSDEELDTSENEAIQKNTKGKRQGEQGSKKTKVAKMDDDNLEPDIVKDFKFSDDES